MQSCLHFCWYLSLWTLTSTDIYILTANTLTWRLWGKQNDSKKPLGIALSSLLLSISSIFVIKHVYFRMWLLVFELWSLLIYCLFWGESSQETRLCVKCSLIPRLPWPATGEPGTSVTKTITCMHTHSPTPELENEVKCMKLFKKLY